jgi:hypothetical protein
MKIVLRILSVLFVAIAAFLLFAVIAALSSDEGARAGVAIGYVVGAAVLIAGAVAMWKSTSRSA